MSNPSTEFMSQGPGAILDYVKQQFSGGTVPDSTMNWHGVAEVAAHRAREDAEALTWLEVAIRIYDWLASTNSEPDHSSFMSSGMLARVNRLRWCPGTVAEDSARRLEVLNWFHRSKPFTASEAKARAEKWREISVPEILALRRLKNKLNVVALLFSSGAGKPDAEVAEWLVIRPNLP
jgi:hypothetical protein